MPGQFRVGPLIDAAGLSIRGGAALQRLACVAAQTGFVAGRDLVGVEQVELTEPWRALKEAGATPRVIAPDAGEVQAFKHLDKGDVFTVDEAVASASPDSYDALLLPGGVANPDQLRTCPEAVTFAKSFFNAGKPVAVICHGPWTLVEADVVRGRRITSWSSLRTDLRKLAPTGSTNNWWYAPVGRTF
jgi:protease I